MNVNEDNVVTVTTMPHNKELIIKKLKELIKLNPGTSINIYSNFNCKTTIGDKDFSGLITYGNIIKIGNYVVFIEDINYNSKTKNEYDDSKENQNFMSFIRTFLNENNIPFFEMELEKVNKEDVDFFSYKNVENILKLEKVRKPEILIANTIDELNFCLRRAKNDKCLECAIVQNLRTSIDLQSKLNLPDSSVGKDGTFSYFSNDFILTNSNIILLSPSFMSKFDNIYALKKLIEDLDLECNLLKIENKDILSQENFANNLFKQKLMKLLADSTSSIDSEAFFNPLVRNLRLKSCSPKSKSKNLTPEQQRQIEEELNKERIQKGMYREQQRAEEKGLGINPAITSSNFFNSTDDLFHTK